MAEISYPFAEDNATTGASKAVSETQWQAMATMWGGDRVDFSIGPGAYSSTDLPFAPKVISVTSLQIGPGKAWVGGFKYELTDNLLVPIDANSSNTGRKDLVVIRADMAVPAVNIAVRKGVNSTAPAVPSPVRQVGDKWEMPLYEVNVPANGGTVTMSSRLPYNMPPAVGYPWNAADSSKLMPMGAFAYDLDSNLSGSQNERFVGQDGPMITRSFGPMYEYTPDMYHDSNVPNSFFTRKGHWRWIAPNTVSFIASVYNTIANTETDKGVPYGIKLPVPASAVNRQVLSGFLLNSAGNGIYPNSQSLTGLINPSTPNYASIYIPSTTGAGGGLDNFHSLPSKSTIYFSGTYEANIFD